MESQDKSIEAQNFYELLEISTSATSDEIEIAQKSARKKWQKRSSASSPAIQREASLAMERIKEAGVVLLDDVARAAYDQTLLSLSSKSAASSHESAESQLESARYFLQNGDIQNAEYASKEATAALPGNPYAWHVRSLASLAGNQTQDAVFSSMQAVALGNDPAFNLQLADALIAQQNYPEAEKALIAAQKLFPDAEHLDIALLELNLKMGKIELAAKEARQKYLAEPDSPKWAKALALVLYSQAMAVPQHTNKQGFILTSQFECEKMEKLLVEAEVLADPGSWVAIESAKALKEVQFAKKRVLSSPGCLLLVLFIVAGLFFVLPSFIAVIAGLTSIINYGGFSAEFLPYLLFPIGYVFGFYFTFFVPRWKVNQRKLRVGKKRV